MRSFARRTRSNFRRISRRTQCRGASGLLLAIYVVTAVGVPLPAGNLAKKSGKLFPCMDCPCGCNSAEQCWRSCCCHSLAERMDWAHDHGVRPPDYAIDEARQQGIDLCWLDEPAGAPAKTCCTSSSTPGKRCCCCCHHDEHAPAQADQAAGRVVVLRALACGGQSMNCLAAVPTLIAVRHDLAGHLALTAWLGPPNSAYADGIAEEPVVPPPERA